jgi:hypothetical protein
MVPYRGPVSAWVLAPVADPQRLAWTAAAIAWVLAVPMFYFTKYVSTVTHEGGHAAIAKMLLQKVLNIRIERGGNGETNFALRLPWLVDIPVTVAGHLGPSMFGLAGVWLLRRDLVGVTIWASIAFLLLMLFAVVGKIGWFIIPACVVGLYLIATEAEEPRRTLYTHIWVWFLLITAVQQLLLVIGNKAYLVEGSDFKVMEGLTKIPAEIWAVGFLVAAIAALAFGGAALLRT